MTYKILIVDDSKLARMAVIKVLRECHPDWSRVEAGSAEEALTAMERDAPDLALVDFNMPHQDGLHLAATFRTLNPQMPIAIVSANHQKEIIERTLALGASFLPKPLAAKTLGTFLEAAARQLTSVPR